MPEQEEAERQAERQAEPRRTMRSVTVAVMALTAIVTGWLAWSLRGEAAYALRSQTPTHAGILTDADLAGHEGSFVRGYARLDGQSAVRFRRPLERDAYRVAQAAPAFRGGTQDAAKAEVWVVYGVPAALDGPRFVPPQLVAGRLSRVEDLGVRYGGLADAIAELGGKSNAWVLIDGEDPEGLGWLLGLEVLLLAFIGFNALAIGRVMRRIPPDPAADTTETAETASG